MLAYKFTDVVQTIGLMIQQILIKFLQSELVVILTELILGKFVHQINS